MGNKIIAEDVKIMVNHKRQTAFCFYLYKKAALGAGMLDTEIFFFLG